MDSLWSHLVNLPGWNAHILISTLMVGLIMSWACAGAFATAMRRYPPRRGYSRSQRLYGRRAWAFVVFFLASAAWSFYRVDALWWLAQPVSNKAVAVEVLRVIAALWISIAWWPGVDIEGS